jgi:hypothetical protein
VRAIRGSARPISGNHENEMARSKPQFNLYYYWGTLVVLCIGAGVYFAFHLASNLILLSFLLVSSGAICAVAGLHVAEFRPENEGLARRRFLSKARAVALFAMAWRHLSPTP